MSELAPVLAGTRVLVTAQRRSDELADALRRRGAGVVVAPTLGVVSDVDEPGLLAMTKTILADPVDVLVVTTGVGLRSWFDTAAAAGLRDELVDALQSVQVVARGQKARGALHANGVEPAWVAASETSAEIVRHLLTEGVAGKRVAVQHHAAGDPTLERHLTDAGATVLPLEVYRWGPPEDPRLVTDAVLGVAAGEFDAVLFTSAPGAIAFLGELERQGVGDLVRDLAATGRLVLAAVGPVTADPLVNAGMTTLCPDRSRMGALVRLVITTLGTDVGGVRTPAGTLRVRAAGATLDHRPLRLSPGALEVLRRLARHPGEVVGHDELLPLLPDAGSGAPAGTPGRAGTTPSDVTEDVVAELEQALGATGLVRTVVRRGYVLDVG